ncbi:MAG: UDP-2,3-diacetamido-2,3-dideoxy-D-glucuronate 2-epimerase [Burkholderiaceae bacterium]|nr:UDP-2,3-diacetamido-2,3-dideoxy-D-glucuronate 2-epimerase [Burkholderiaceae bacterium]
MRKVVTVLGARPQLIKASAVSHVMAQSHYGLREVMVHTGQHFDANMSGVFFEELGMAPPAYDLGIHGGTHGAMTGRMLARIEEVLLSERPHAVLVYGDTNSTLAGALAAAKLHIPVAHVEAGLRSFNLRMPEEINRMLTDRLARWLFTPTAAASAHLLREGVDDACIVPTGDVMYDVALQQGARAEPVTATLDAMGVASGAFALATVHRAENTDDATRLAEIVDGLQQVSARMPVVWPVHPRTRAALAGLPRPVTHAGLKLCEPLGYLDMVRFEKHAAVIATDSGGVQKEAFFHKVPCVTLRDETEWVELVDTGWNRLVPPKSAAEIAAAILDAIGKPGVPIEPYGRGDAAQRIVQRLHSDLVA